MLTDYRFLCSEIFKGKSVLRAFLNLKLKDLKLQGKTIDIGGGAGAKYLSFMKKDGMVTFETFDIKNGQDIDFEKDSLPAEDGTYDTVLFLNVMEHIFNYQHIANEVVRITKKDGQIIGFVPFLMWYHPDHRDFFRYTHEALQKIFERTDVQNVYIKAISRGPFTASSHITLLSYPKFFRIPLFTVSYIMDFFYLKFRKQNISKYPLGYMFIAKK